MSKSKTKVVVDPFNAFKVIKGEFGDPNVDPNNEIQDKDTSLIEDEEKDLTDDEKARMLEADKKLEPENPKLARKQSKNE